MMIVWELALGALSFIVSEVIRRTNNGNTRLRSLVCSCSHWKKRTLTLAGAHGMVPAAASLLRPSWAAAVSSASCAPNSHDSVGTSVRVLSRPVERLVTTVVATFLP